MKLVRCHREVSDITVTFLVKIVKLHLSSFSLNIFTLTNNGLLTANWLYSIFVCSIYISFICSTQRDKIHPVSQEETWAAYSTLMSMILDWNLCVLFIRITNLSGVRKLIQMMEFLTAKQNHFPHYAFRSKQNQEVPTVLLFVLQIGEHTRVGKEIMHDTVQTNVAFVLST